MNTGLRWGQRGLAALAVMAASVGVVPTTAAADHDGTQGAGPHAVHYGDGCADNVLDRNDDDSTGLIALSSSTAFPSGLNLFGANYAALFVNNNGNVTFESAWATYTPTPLAGVQTPPMIAPYFGDVDTRGAASDVVRYGMTTFAGRPAFCVLWAGVGVGYYSAGVDKLNEFQLLLVDRSDVGAGDFDIVFNYDQVQWEAGSASGGSGGLGGVPARAGYTNGNGVALELPGSGQVGGFLDTNTTTGLIHNSAGQGLSDAQQLGRFVFPVRNGAPPPAGSIAGDVTRGDPLAPAPVHGAIVSACGGDDPATAATETTCQSSVTNADGHYLLPGLRDGAYTVSVSPPGDLVPQTLAALVSGGPATVDFHLVAPTPPPAGTLVGGSPAGEVPTVVIGRAFDIVVPCADGGSGSLEFYQDGDLLTVLHNGVETESVELLHNGVDALTADGIVLRTTGVADAVLRIACGTAEGVTTEFDIYIDPSGDILDQRGNPVAGATVTLLRSDTPEGPFTVVPDGSTIMSPANRTNPQITGGDGHYGWMTVPGWYLVRATPPDGCTVPAGVTTPYVESAVLPVPPEQTGIDLVLECIRNTAPELTVPADMIADATSPAGALVAYETTVADAEQPDLTATCVPASGSTFAIGATTVRCSVTDQGGLSDEATFAVQVLGAAEQIENLRATIRGYALPDGREQSLLSKLETASSSLSAGNAPDACGALRALLNHTAAQKDKSLTAAQADAITAATTRIRAVIGC